MSRLRGTAMRGAVVAGAIAAGFFLLRQPAMSAHPFPNRQSVPPLPDGIEWVNGPEDPSGSTPKSLRLEDFRGKFVLMDFWTYCCINCMHVLPELKKLERAYPDTLVVIGVHTGKFEAERDAANIREAIRRHRIEHPVLNDAKHEVWNRFGVRAWPTLLLIDPEGMAIWGKSGEATFEEVSAVLRRAIPYYRGQRLLDEKPRALGLAGDAHDSPLRFPGKVLADAEGRRLFVADTGHHRIVIAGLDGRLVDAIGDGQPGRADGEFAKAQFDSPQGMALVGAQLFVADTENHLIRRVDLDARRVTTVAGKGAQLRAPAPLVPSSRPRQIALASPWALAVHDEHLFIAMAGTHQIWRMALDGSKIGPFAGNGVEDIVDGRRLPSRPFELGAASFAQPSGLATDGAWLYVADSEGSSIRAVSLAPNGPVRTLVGTAGLPEARLFTFGDVDGAPGQARLQHPLGIALAGGRLFVADTYNNKIKEVDLATGAVRTLVLTGEAATDPLDEPSGLSALSDKLYVADTNRHRVRVIHLDENNRLETLPITGLAPPDARP
ncbi:MAG: redoxin domain-containing protein [Pirellulales bacterium]|nr:redoxin domain-containing protein [Pirellulales bacterium]